MTDEFDDLHPEHCRTRTPREFITRDSCHTHSLEAGQRVNVSMQDGWTSPGSWRTSWTAVHANRRSAILLDYSHKD